MSIMSSKFSFVFVLCALICLSVVSFATPIKDIASTDLAISETKTSTSERFAVSVKRVDDLVGDNGEFLAERIEAVIINFEFKNDQLLVNDVPVQMDMTSFQVIEAQIVPADIDAEQFEQYADNFDIGLVTVQILPMVESLSSEEGVTLRRISITVLITEIDGVSVVQTQGALEKVVEFKVLEIADGDQDVIVPLYADEDLSSQPSNKTDGHHRKVKCIFRSLAARVRHWWRCASRFTRIVVASLFLTATFGLLFMAIPAAVQTLMELARRHTSSPYSAVVNDEDHIVEQVIFITDEEKRALLEQEKDLAQ